MGVAQTYVVIRNLADLRRCCEGRHLVDFSGSDSLDPSPPIEPKG